VYLFCYFTCWAEKIGISIFMAVINYMS